MAGGTPGAAPADDTRAPAVAAAARVARAGTAAAAVRPSASAGAVAGCQAGGSAAAALWRRLNVRRPACSSSRSRAAAAPMAAAVGRAPGAAVARAVPAPFADLPHEAAASGGRSALAPTPASPGRTLRARPVFQPARPPRPLPRWARQPALAGAELRPVPAARDGPGPLSAPDPLRQRPGLPVLRRAGAAAPDVRRSEARALPRLPVRPARAVWPS